MVLVSDIKLIMKSLASKGQTIDAKVLANLIKAPDSDLPRIQSLMVKVYYLDNLDYNLTNVNGNFVLVPKNTNMNGVNTLKQVSTDKKVSAKSERVFWPDKYGRVRVPASLMRSIGSQSSKDVLTEIWLAKKDDGRVTITTTPPSNLNGYRRHTPDQYNNLQFKVPDVDKPYRMAKVGKNIVVSPVV